MKTRTRAALVGAVGGLSLGAFLGSGLDFLVFDRGWGWLLVGALGCLVLVLLPET